MMMKNALFSLLLALLIATVAKAACPTLDSVLGAECTLEGLICDYVTPEYPNQEASECNCGAADPTCPCYSCVNGVFVLETSSTA
jgi:hypothetical protein